MHTTRLQTKDGEIVLNHNSDWSGKVRVKWIEDGRECEVWVPGELCITLAQAGAAHCAKLLKGAIVFRNRHDGSPVEVFAAETFADECLAYPGRLDDGPIDAGCLAVNQDEMARRRGAQRSEPLDYCVSHMPHGMEGDFCGRCGQAIRPRREKEPVPRCCID